jgi:hypothetical protein
VACGGALKFANLYDFVLDYVSHVGCIRVDTFPVDEKVCLDFNEWWLHVVVV